MKLWLDDTRPAPVGWEWAHTAYEAIDYIDTYRNEITHVSLDHDLGASPGELWRAGDSPYTGQLVADFIASCGFLDTSVYIRVHSWNPAGAERMASVLRDAGYDVDVIPFSISELTEVSR